VQRRHLLGQQARRAQRRDNDAGEDADARSHADNGRQRHQRLRLWLFEVPHLPALPGGHGIEAHQHMFGGIDEVHAELVGGPRDLEQAVLLIGRIAGSFGGHVEAQPTT